MKYFRKYLTPILILILLIISLSLFYQSFVQVNDKYLKVIFLDVGQGDAIYVEAPNGRQMLIDGGGGSVILPQLIKVMPFADKSIDIVVATNPDQDHIGGLVEVLNNYQIGRVLESGTKNSSSVYQKFEKEIEENKIEKTIALRGMKIILDNDLNIYFAILFPDRDVSNWERNDGSIVGKLVYEDISFMLMGDATKYTENLIHWNENSQILNSDIIKLGHHGSDTSSGVLWLKDVNPQMAIISAGENNRYGHPHFEVLDRLKNLHIPYLITAEEGNIVFKTDGKILIYK